MIENAVFLAWHGHCNLMLFCVYWNTQSCLPSFIEFIYYGLDIKWVQKVHELKVWSPAGGFKSLKSSQIQRAWA